MSKKMKYSFNFKKMCTPAFVYFVISVVVLLTIVIGNLKGDSETLCLSPYHKCTVVSKTMVFSMHAIHTLFWTFILDLLCKTGYKKLSWFIVILPDMISKPKNFFF